MTEPISPAVSGDSQVTNTYSLLTHYNSAEHLGYELIVPRGSVNDFIICTGGYREVPEASIDDV